MINVTFEKRCYSIRYDLLVEKILEDKFKLEDYFPDYSNYKLNGVHNNKFYVYGENNHVTKAKLFILGLFLEKADRLFDSRAVFCKPYFTCAVETKNINDILLMCHKVLK